MISCGKLREAAKAGNIDSLYAVIRKDPYILDRIDQVPFIDTPVQVAVTSGQDDFAVEVMNLKPSLARKLNTDGYSPIHLAIQDERMVLCLFEIDKNLVRVKGREGYAPLHYAAEQGNLCLLAQFLVNSPECHGFNTYFYYSSMRKKLLNWKDKDGNTALHVAAYNQPQMIKFLLDCKVKVNEIISSGKTPLDVIQELQTLDEASKRDSMKILRNAEALNASLTPRPRHLTQIIENKYYRPRKSIGSSAVLVILVLILTSTYQATLSPPGEPNSSDKKSNHMNSKCGKSTLNYSRDFRLFYVPNTIAFIVTFILTLGLLAVVASRITWLLLPPLLLLYFCLLSSTFDISPENAPVFIAFAPLLSLPIMFRVIRHAKCLGKYTGEKL
ncbi:hypothetical protein ES332_D05G335700v1 [Gossypium tomentosum]|uniref:PGG domain-containing protein n=1 Tax=Gossypium tomentosum TaxID=34277 RepID=A0A5D2L2H9_GOSTO|nr:hypothetical protein ES332_D05G335700v1 [Gossypium tomentosum]